MAKKEQTGKKPLVETLIDAIEHSVKRRKKKPIKRNPKINRQNRVFTR